MISRALQVEPPLGEQLWQLYYPEMHRVQSDTPYKQEISREQFDSFMVSPQFIKYILYSGKTPVGLLLVVTDIAQPDFAKLQWLSHDYFKAHFGTSQIYYVIGMAVSRDHSHLSMLGGKHLIDALIEDLPEGTPCLYDYSQSLHANFAPLGQRLAHKDGMLVSEVDNIHFVVAQRQ